MYVGSRAPASLATRCAALHVAGLCKTAGLWECGCGHIRHMQMHLVQHQDSRSHSDTESLPAPLRGCW
eukprot:COSAG03_NODE_4494_length_1533_cov_1.610879_2_plen_67_part_01